MNKIISFKEFTKKASDLGEDTADINLGLPQDGSSVGAEESHHDVQFYMFFPIFFINPISHFNRFIKFAMPMNSASAN